MRRASVRRHQSFYAVFWFCIAALPISLPANAEAASRWHQTPIIDRNVDVPRGGATKHPRNEFEQSLYLNWPVYRTPQGQGAFNAAMATLKSSEGPAPHASIFKGCRRLHCALGLPAFDRNGWFPSGRIWVSSTDYVLFVRWPRRPPAFVKRRGKRTMRYFVFHEFHNATGNTDTYDTVSSHRGRVFVPFYLTKTHRDAKGHRFAVLIQVAPYDVRSIHASNRNSAGPGIEVAKNTYEQLEPLQAKAGILIATMTKRRAPQLRVVNHRGSEGRPMLRAYMQRIKVLRRAPRSTRLVLPFNKATSKAINAARAELGELIKLPVSFRNQMIGRLLGGKRKPERAVAAFKPQPNLLRSPQIVNRRPGTIHRRSQSVSPKSNATSPLTAFLRASPGSIQLLSPPRRISRSRE